MNRGRRNWTLKEDLLLQHLVQKELDNSRPVLWRELAKHIPSRSNKDCRKRWWNSLAGGNVKGAWSPEEDKRLVEAVEKYGSNWVKVASVVGSRCGDQCSSHWRQSLNPDINYCDWSEEEDQQLLDAVRVHGTNWATIATFHTPNRTTLALKNRYWKLQARKENDNKSTPLKASAVPTPSKTTPIRVTGTTASLGDDDGSEEDDGDEEYGSHKDESEAEGQVASGKQPYGDDEGIHWLGDGANKSAQPHEPNPQKVSSMWVGYNKEPLEMPSYYPTPGGSVEPWMESLTDDAMGGGGGTQLYPNDGLFNTPVSEHHSSDYTVLQLIGQDGTGEVTNPYFSQVDGSQCLDPEMFKNYNALSDDLGKIENHFTTANLFVPETRGTDLVRVDSTSKDKTTEPVLHRVSISLSCTTGQLSNVMSLLASKGLTVNMKIDTP